MRPPLRARFSPAHPERAETRSNPGEGLPRPRAFFPSHTKAGERDALKCARAPTTVSSWGVREHREHPLIPLLNLHSHLLRLRNHFLDRPHHIERLFRQVIVFAIDDFLEAANRVL